MNKLKISYIHILSCIAILFLCCLQITALDYIVVINDEFGYWSLAASAVGYDWKELIAETPYYSWGYSIWLIPIIALLPTPELWYKAAIFLNVIFLLLSYFFCFKSGRKLFPGLNDKIMALISLVVIIYPSNIIYAQVAWPESLCYFLVWLEFYLILRLDEHFSFRYYVLSLVIALYGYAVHNRNIGILLSSVIVLLFLLIKHKQKIIYYLLLPLIIVAGYKGIDLIKMYQINTLWENSKTSSINNVGVNVATITSYATRITQEIKQLLISIMGKYFYIIIGFELTFPIVIIRFFKDTFASIKEKKVFQNYLISKFWILLTGAAMFGICALQMNRWDLRKDCIVYGRYMENCFGPLLLLAITETILFTKEARTALIDSLTSILACIFPVFYYMDHVSAGFNMICSPIIGIFFRIVNETPKTFILLGIFLAIVLLILYIALSVQRQHLKIGLILLCFGVSYASMSCMLSIQAADNRQGYDDCRLPIREQISQDLAECEIYYIKNTQLDSTSINPKYLQYAIPDRTIHVILPEEIPAYLSKNVILMTNPNDTETMNFLDEIGTRFIDCNYLLAVYSTK